MSWFVKVNLTDMNKPSAKESKPNRGRMDSGHKSLQASDDSGLDSPGRNLQCRLEKEPDDETSFVELWGIYHEQGAWDAMARLLESRLLGIENQQSNVTQLIKLGDLCDQKLLQKMTSHIKHLGTLPLYKELIVTYAKLIRFAAQPQNKSWLRRHIARLYRDGLHDTASAFFELIRVARYSPNQPGLIEELIAMGISCQKQLELTAVLEDLGTRLNDRGKKADLYTRLARLYMDELQNTELASTAISQALESLPSYIPAQLTRFDILSAQKEYQALAQALEAFLSRSDVLDETQLFILEKLWRVLFRAKQYDKSIHILERLTHLTSSHQQRSRYLKTVGDIQHKWLKNHQRALDFYSESLHWAPLDNRALAPALKILNQMRDWPRLRDMYEDLLKRLPPPIVGQPDRRLPILTELVELYRYRLNDPKRAIGACERLLAVSPGNIKVREDLARLYEATGRLQASLAVHRSLIFESPFCVDSYHALRRMYADQGQRDRALCVAATLAFLEEATQEELALLAEKRHFLPLRADRPLPESLYNRLLQHPYAGGLLGEIFSLAADCCRQAFAVSHREHRLNPREALNLNDSTSEVATVFRKALQFFGSPAPEIYARRASVKDIMTLNTSPVSLLYSDNAFRRASNAELRFMVGRALTFTRPENLLAGSLSLKQLSTLLEAIVEIVFPGRRPQPVPKDVIWLARKIGGSIPSHKVNRLQQLASSYRTQAEDLSIREWVEGVEHTCNRAGFVYCGELEAAIQVLKNTRVVIPSGSSRALIRELIFYSISEDYFELREALGVTRH